MHITSFNWVDLSIIGIIVISMLISLVRGFIREALSLASWIIAIWVGIKFAALGGEYLKPYISSNQVRVAVAFLIIFVACILAGAIISFIIAQLVQKTGLSGTDRVLGLVFGLGRGVLVVAVILLIVNITAIPKDTWWKSSNLIPQFQPLTVWLKDMLPDSMKTENAVTDAVKSNLVKPENAKPDGLKNGQN